MYQYNQHDRLMISERVSQFRGQAERFLAGELEPQQFLPLRLQNGLYKQRLAYMLRIAVPYGNLSTRQLRKLAEIARKYDKGFGHFSTRQNMQLHWPELEDVPTILAELASVEMHAIQTSGNCIRNTTADHFSGVAADEVEDARPYCEIIRQWSTFHPEFAFLPRKFKIAVCGSENDRAAMHIHDIGVEIVRNLQGETGFKILVGGGLGRTPVIGEVINEFLPKKHLLTYLEAILRVYNQLGRRDNKFKARIKILVRAMGPEAFREKVEAEWVYLKDGANTLTDEIIAHAQSFFQAPAYEKLDGEKEDAELNKLAAGNFAFARWLKYNTAKHKQPGYAIVTLSLKTTGVAPGDATSEQMEAVADLADQFGFGEIRTSHEQNLILPDIRQRDLFTVWKAATQIGFATPNVGHLTDIICCPGGDYCSLANAKSIPVAEAIQRRFDDLDYIYDLGELDLNISGCMNACGHHHVGHIGILGVDKKGAEFYQISLGGNQGKDAALGEILGPSFSQADVPDVIEKILQTYLDRRQDGEIFLATFRRIGLEPFKERVYG